MRVLVVGSGGREHALVRALLRSPQSPEVLCAPGNAGIRRDARPLDAPADDPAALAGAARDAGVDLVVVGPEVPLVAGLADALAAVGVRCFGPPAAAARLEGSKAFAKEIMAAAGVPTAAHRVVASVDEGMAAISGYPAVIKADGLAAGKGVVIAADEAEARAALEDMLVARQFGDQPVVVEEFLAGDELSLLALCDGERAIPLAPARDYKRIGEGDAGPNTGGMGSFSPVAGTEELVRDVIASVHQPVVEELARRGSPFQGVLYAGLMLERRRLAPRCSSSTCASAIPRRRSSCRACAPTCWRCCSRRPSAAASRAPSSTGTRAPPSAWCSPRADTPRAPRRET